MFPCPRAPEPDPASTRRATALVSAFSSCCLFRAPSQSPPLTLFRERAHCRSFVPQRDITRSVHSLPRGFQPSLRSVLGCSQPLDGFLRFRAPRLVSSSSRVQGSPSFRGFSLHAAPLPLVEGGGPPAVVATGAPQTLRPGSPHQQRLGFEALLRAKVRSHRFGDQPHRRSLPSSGSTPPGSPSSGPVMVTHRRTLMAFVKTDLRLRARRSSPSPALCLRRTGRVCLQIRRPARVSEPAVQSP